MTRRNFFARAGLTGLTGLLAQSSHADEPNAQLDPSNKQVLNQADLNQQYPPGEPGKDYTPVITPNVSTLPYKVVASVKVFHLIAGEVDHEFAAGLRAECWGFNNQVHGPTIEVVEGDRVRIYVTNQLPEATSTHWHGVLVPNGMDGVGGLNQKPIEPGETYKYEFQLRQHGTCMYHSHTDDM